MKNFGKFFDSENTPKIDKYRRTYYRTLLKKEAKLPANAEKGKVYTSIGRIFHVMPVDFPEGEIPELIECSRAGTIISENENTSVVAVGDDVLFIRDSKTSLSGTIIKVCERKTWLSRKEPIMPKEQILASNVDKLIIFVSAFDPPYNKRLIDRFLVAAEQGELEPAICINKIDLDEDLKGLKEDFACYKKMGIKLFFISTLNNKGIQSLKNYLKGFDSVMAGSSGSGKSTLMNLLIKEEYQKVLSVSDKTSKGMHTTSFVRMFDLPFGGKLIDTPGIREFAVWNVPKEEIPLYFKDFEQFYGDCKFMPCTHTHEPDCAVKEAVEKGKLDAGRYESYLNIFVSI